MDHSTRLSQEEFVVLIARHERRVRGFVATLVKQRNDIDEIVQQSFLTAWKKLRDFVRVADTLDSDFARWLCTIARFETLNFVRKNQAAGLMFSTDLVGELADAQLKEDSLDVRDDALHECLKKLPANHVELIRQHYSRGEAVKSIAKRRGVSPQAVYKKIRAIRMALLECIERSLGETETSI